MIFAPPLPKVPRYARDDTLSRWHESLLRSGVSLVLFVVAAMVVGLIGTLICECGTTRSRRSPRKSARVFQPRDSFFSRNEVIPARRALITFGPTAWSSIAAVHTCAVPQPSRK